MLVGALIKDLTVTVSTERTESEVELVEDANERCAINGQSFVDEQEWNLHTYVNRSCMSFHRDL